jgi:hypothetical protein
MRTSTEAASQNQWAVTPACTAAPAATTVARIFDHTTARITGSDLSIIIWSSLSLVRRA